MAVEIPLEPDEKVVFSEVFQSDAKSIPFAFAISQKAVFFSKEKHFAMESWAYKRIPLETIKHVFLKPERPLFLWLTAIVTFLFGAALTVLMIMTYMRPEPGEKTLWVLPFVITACGIALPFLARERKILVVEAEDRTYKWKPKMLWEKPARERVKTMQENIMLACEQAGIRADRH